MFSQIRQNLPNGNIKAAVVLTLLFVSIALNMMMLTLVSDIITKQSKLNGVVEGMDSEYFQRRQVKREVLELNSPYPQVPRRRWENKPNFIDTIIAEDKPVVLYDTLMEKTWPAFKLWNYDYFGDTWGKDKILNVIFSPFPTIWRYSEKYFWPGVVPLHNSKDITYSKFRELLKQPEKSGWCYFSSSLKDLDPKFLHDVNITQLAPTGFKGDVSSLLWMGSPGVTSQCHVDHSRNFFVQLQGHKKFFLVPTHAYELLHLIPRNHPHERRCNINIPHLEGEDKQKLIDAGSMEVTLGAGDILYIPPLTAHHVTNVDSGISVNFWTDTPYAKNIDEDLVDLVPTLPAGTTSKQGLRIYVTILENLFHELDLNITTWMASHYQVRYHKLLNGDYYKKEPNPAYEEICRSLSPVDMKWQPLIEKYVTKVKKNMLKIPEKLRNFHLGDYVDSIAIAAVMGPNKNGYESPKVLYFIKYCFS